MGREEKVGRGGLFNTWRVLTLNLILGLKFLSFLSQFFREENLEGSCNGWNEGELRSTASPDLLWVWIEMWNFIFATINTKNECQPTNQRFFWCNNFIQPFVFFFNQVWKWMDRSFLRPMCQLPRMPTRLVQRTLAMQLPRRLGRPVL